MVNLKICTLNLFFTGVMPSLLCHLESYVKEINSLDIVLLSEISPIGISFIFSSFQTMLLWNEVFLQVTSS